MNNFSVNAQLEELLDYHFDNQMLVMGVSFQDQVVEVMKESGEITSVSFSDLKAVERSLAKADDSEMSFGEQHTTLNRLVVSPAVGVYRPVKHIVVGAYVRTGQVVGWVGDTEVASAVSGFVSENLAHAGERIQKFQPVVWLTSRKEDTGGAGSESSPKEL